MLASFGSARNGLCSGRNEVARFQIWSGPEASFVSAGPDWKRARFGLTPPVPGPDSIPTSHPPAPIRARGGGLRLATRRGDGEETARQRTDVDGDGDGDLFPSDVRALRCLLAGNASPC
uniref:Uncharacterized protein n=1 Tax=Oryza meridionalis TaxID=40149 RepID=A0A0E0D4L7_9ORYZ